jgi:threonine/homoserine/homoserine lactone efflux protein
MLWIYTFTLLVAVASPGPAVAAIVGHVLSHGLKGAFSFIAGIIFGEFFWLAAAVFGVDLIINKYPLFMLILRLCGVGFLFYMAFGMFKAAGRPLEATQIKGNAFLAGLALSASNPKVMVFYLSLLPALIAGQSLSYVSLAVIMLLVTSGVFAGYALLAFKAKSFLSNQTQLKFVQRANALLLACVAVLILVATLKA